jgi:predicted transcriptional regulator
MKQVTESQIDQMKHALGLNCRNEVTRNYFYCDADNNEWNDLVGKGLATKGPGSDDESTYFILTDEGVELIQKVGETNG